MPLNKYPDQPEETVCQGCRLFDTKPETIAEEIEEHFYAALNLAEIERCGGRFAYPDGLSLAEWNSLKALTRGREKAERLDREREKKKARK